MVIPGESYPYPDKCVSSLHIYPYMSVLVFNCSSTYENVESYEKRLSQPFHVKLVQPAPVLVVRLHRLFLYEY